jgi:hypothetical protein
MAAAEATDGHATVYSDGNRWKVETGQSFTGQAAGMVAQGWYLYATTDTFPEAEAIAIVQGVYYPTMVVPYDTDDNPRWAVLIKPTAQGEE